MNIRNPSLERIVEDVTVSNFLRCRETGFQVAEARALLQSTSSAAIERGIARLSRQIEQLRAFLPEESALSRSIDADLCAVAWPIETDDQVEELARECGWENRKYMTPSDYSIWCDRIRKFARLAAVGGRDELLVYYARQIEWSRQTFGPALRTTGVLDHIRKELREIEQDPRDLSEWVDVIILAMDGFWRHGGQARDLMPALLGKQKTNMARVWPDWRTMAEDQAIEHDRSMAQQELPLADEDDDLPRTLEDFEPPMPEWVERVYRYMAEGDLAAAMDEFSREFGLALPSHANAVADLLTSARG